MEQMKRAFGPEELIQFAAKPFCCAMSHHESDRHAFPTLQITARPFHVASNDQAKEILGAQIRAISDQHLDFEPDWSTHEAIVSGFRANMIKGSFVILTQPNDELLEIGVISRSYTVFTPGHAFTLGLSSSDHPDYYSETDFTGIINSVKIGA